MSAFPTIPRLTRSQKNVVQEKLNMSYEHVIHAERGNPSERKALPMSELITDLRNKLASSHSLNSSLNDEIKALNDRLKSQKTQLLVLNGQLNKHITAKKVVQKEACTQTLENELILVDGECQVDSLMLEACTQTESATSLLMDAECQVDCLTMEAPTQTLDVGVGFVDGDCQADLSTQIDEKNSRCSQDSLEQVDCGTVPADLITGSAAGVAADPKERESFDASSVSLTGVNLNENLGDLHSPSGLADIPLSLRRSKRTISKPKVLPHPRVLLICDEIGLGISELLSERLPYKYSVTSIVRTGGSFSYVTSDTDCLTKDFTMMDHVLILMSSRHVHENNSRYIKTGIRKIIAKSQNTNVYMATIPFGFDNTNQNELIYRLNERLEKKLFSCQNKYCVYTNKILFQEDYNRDSLLKKSGKVKLAAYFAEYVLGKRTDDRLLECESNIDDRVIQDTMCVPEVNYTPSKAGSTVVSACKIKEASKNRRTQIKSRKKTLLIKLLKLLQ